MQRNGVRNVPRWTGARISQAGKAGLIGSDMIATAVGDGSTIGGCANGIKSPWRQLPHGS